MITPAQCRGARAMLGWSQQTLAEIAGVSRSTVRFFEDERRNTGRGALAKIEAALYVMGGTELIPETETGGIGIRFRRSKVADVITAIPKEIMELAVQATPDGKEAIGQTYDFYNEARLANDPNPWATVAKRFARLLSDEPD